MLVETTLALGFPEEPGDLRDVEQDGTGTIWAVPEDDSSHLLIQGEQGWQNAPLPANDLGNAYFLGKRRNGRILACWSGNGNFTITEHSKTTARVVARLGRPVNAYIPAHLFVDSRENIWLIEMRGEITRITPEGDAEVHFQAPSPMLFHAPPHADSTNSEFFPLLATEDGAGVIWFWSYCDHSNPYVTLQGLLTFDGHRFVHHAKIKGLPSNARFGFIAPRDAGHLWVGVSAAFSKYQGSLAILDIKTLTLTMPPEPAEAAFAFIRQIFAGPDATYVITGWGGSQVLWRWKDDAWQKLIPDLEEPAPGARSWERPYAFTNAGLLIASDYRGPWLVPPAGAPSQLDWRSGLTFIDLRKLYLTPAAHFFALGGNGRWANGPLRLEPLPVASERLRVLHPQSELFCLANGHVWGWLDAKTPALSEWDGSRWQDYPFPHAPPSEAALSVDSLGRFWLWPSRPEANQATSIFDPMLGHWTTYPSFREALRHEQSHTLTFSLAPSPMWPASYQPIYGSEGRIAYFTGEGLDYFDGSWHFWKPENVTGSAQDAFATLAFDQDGRLRVDDTRYRSWYYTAQTGWRLGRTVEVKTARPTPTPTPPPEMKEPFENLVADQEGGLWFTRQGELYHHRFKLTRPVFEKGEVQPFRDRRSLRRAAVDQAGNAFLNTSNGLRLEYTMVAPRQPLPQTTIAPPIISEDCVTLSFTTVPAQPALLEWRIDNGPWQPAAEHTPITLETLPNGPHRVEATSVNQELRAEKKPSVLTFTLNADLPALVKQRLQLLLKGSDDERNQAFAALVKRPQISQSILRSIRHSADDDQRWWIDATLQEIERAGTKETGRNSE